ncbi:MAG: tetratricopeptide repeat protein [Sphingobacteriaceae bacterium]|nr:tetratricopeptide repeat protein [Sphingobacteriaceae bacterium]
MFYKKARAIYHQYKDFKREAKAAFSIATTKSNMGLTDESLHELDSLSDFFKKDNNQEFLGMCYSNMADIYDTKGEFDKCIELLFKAIKIFEECKKPERIARANNELANLFREKGDFNKALHYGFEALRMREELGLKMGMGVTYTTLGNIYGQMNDQKNSIKYMLLSYKLYEEAGIPSGVGVVCNNLGLMYQDINVDSSIYFFKKSIEIKLKYTSHAGIAASYINIGQSYMMKKDFKNATSNLLKGLSITRQVKDNVTRRNAYEGLAECYGRMNSYELAFKYQDSLVNLNDSIFNIESSEEIAEMEALYQNEKKTLEIDNLQKIKSVQLAEIKKQNIYKVFYAVGFVLMLALAFVAYRNYARKRRDNEIISQQKVLVEEKQKEVMGSITYARYLQNAILPSLSSIKENFPESFVIYQPKDIVAGDFYWMYKVEGSKSNQLLIAAADCTGHGVPGAMVSIVCSNALNRTVKEFKITEPGKILDNVRDLVIETFQKSEAEVKDGMDISLCSIERENSSAVKIRWAGANNPFWYIKEGEFKELTPNKQPIGKTISPSPFTTQIIELSKGDSLFLFTDGFADQFGGDQGKKFKYKQFKDLLLSTSAKNIEAQKTEILKIFKDWKGNFEQVDDVCLIAIRI